MVTKINNLINPFKGNRVVNATKIDRENAVTRYYRDAKGRVVEKKKAGRTSRKDPILRTLNAYREAGGDAEITRIFSKKSRVLRGTEDMLAVEIRKTSPVTGNPKTYRGWLYTDKQGRTKLMYEGGGNSLLGALKGLDDSAPQRPGEIRLVTLYSMCTPAARAKIADILKDWDWDAVFRDEIYNSADPDEGADVEEAYRIRDRVREIIAEVTQPM